MLLSPRGFPRRQHDLINEEFRLPANLQLRPSLALAQELVQEFFALTRRRDAAALEPWRERVAGSGLGELQRFSAGLQRDQDAVVAGLTLEWSTGPVEGQINRLRMLKRQMYGRDGVNLLRARVLPLAAAA